METKTDVIYCRFSSELQRQDSIKDQERRCRDGLDRKGIDHRHIQVIKDEAISGTQDKRDGLDQIKDLMRSGRLGKLVVTEQSRLTRGDNAKALINDIVFHGGRFISITEGIDTDEKGWGLTVSFTQMHHSRSNEDTAERVRGGQEGRVLDGDGSAGDYPYGHRSEYIDPKAALSYRGRGPKPPKRVMIDDAAASVVRDIFARFNDGASICAITRYLNSVQHEIPRIGKGDWHHEHVRRILTNKKYIGIWDFGKTTTVRDSTGKKKQVPARADQKISTVQRPHLRIIDQPSWDQAQQRLAKLMAVYGMKAGDKERGPSEHYRVLYPKTLLGGLIVCGECGSRLTTGSAGAIKRMACPKHRAASCSMTARVPYALAETKILDLFHEVFIAYPGWITEAVAEMRRQIEAMAGAVPDDLVTAEAQLAQTQKELDNLADAVANGLKSETILNRLRDSEQAKEALTTKVKELEDVQSAPIQLPDEGWIREQLAKLSELMREELPKAASILRAMLGNVIAEEVKIPGKKRGYSRLRFRIDGWAAVRAVLGDQLPHAVMEALEPKLPNGKEFVIDLGAPSRLDQLGPKIVALRRQGVKWTQIAEQTGLSLGNAYTAFKRCQDLPSEAA